MIAVEDLQLIERQLQTVKSFYQNKRIFLTGGTGFFGKWLLEAFLYLNKNSELNVNITVLSRNPVLFGTNYPHLYHCEHFQFIEGDVRDFKFPEGRYDFIIHAATDASATLNEKDPALMRSTILEGAEHMCEFAQKAQCKRVLYTSSGAAYGPQPAGMKGLKEDFVNNPDFNLNDAYASSKLESENYFKDNLSCDVVITRCFAFAGPYLPLDGTFAFGNFIRDALKGKDITLKGDGTAIRSYLYAADLVVWLLKAFALGENKSIYNVGSPYPVTTLELAQNICGDGNNVHVLKQTSDKGNVYVPCTSKSQNDLGVELYTSLNDAIEKTIKFYRISKL